jgi:dipeptidyl aminopeptidase/acylaminoacyl peptidase
MSDDEVPLEELASLPTRAHETVSPGGDRIAMYYDASGRNELCVLDVETGELSQVSDGEVPRNARWFIRWDADGESVYFHLDEAGNEQNDIHRLGLDGTHEPVVELEGQTILTDVSGDGEHLLLGSTQGGQLNVYRHDVAADETVQLTEYDRAATPGEFSPDGSLITYTTNESADFDNQDVYVADVDGSNARSLDIGDTGAEASFADWHPDGDRILVGDNTEDLTRCGVYDLNTGSVEWHGDLAVEESPVAFVDEGRFVAQRTRRAATVPVVYDLATGESREFDLPEGVASVPGTGEPVLDDGRVILGHTTPTQRSDLLAYDLETDEYEVLVAADYGGLDPDVFVDAEYFEFASDGTPETPARAVEHDPYETLDIEGIFYDSGERPSPLVVKIHGGPPAQDQLSFDLYTQFLVTRGYSVVQVNYRGSTGRGRAFKRAIYDDWGGAEQGDIATGAEHVLEEHGFLDEDRVAVFGGSYGGYSAYWQMVQYPDLYDAGIAWIGLTDLSEMFETTMPHFRTELMEKNLGTPADNPDLYEARSPITHVDNLSAPLFVIHGVNDRRVPISQARRFRDALREHGYEEGPDSDFEYEELGEEGHASTDQEQKLRAFELMNEFLTRRMPGQEPTPVDD